VAHEVVDCGEGFALLGFELGGKHVQLFDSGSQTRRFEDREMLLLGGDSNRYVLYDCRNDATVRVPTADVVVVQ
jgi:hypothetical protein